jgi:hypothetical protein
MPHYLFIHQPQKPSHLAETKVKVQNDVLFYYSIRFHLLNSVDDSLKYYDQLTKGLL